MKAVYVREFGGAENLEIREVDKPPGPEGRQVLVRVEASALNRADVLQRRGFYPAPEGFPERILGLEFAGEVAGVGAAAAANFKPGDRVFGITAGGAQAEFLLTDESLLARIPENLSFAEAAAVPEAFITAQDAIFTQGGLGENETLLIHAVGSGVGLAALQLAKAKGARAVGTSRTADKLEKAGAFGLDEGILTDRETDFAAVMREKTGGGVDVILDLVGAGYLRANLESLNQKGRLILVGTPAGSRAELDYSLVMAKRLKIIGTVLRPRPTGEKAAATRAFENEVVPLLASGQIIPNVDRVFGIEQIREAHEYLESNGSFGKVVLEF